MIRFDFKTYTSGISLDENKMKGFHPYLEEHKDATGWMDLDSLAEQTLIEDIKKTAEDIRNNCDVFLVAGIGGSYLGAKAAIEALQPYFYNGKKKPEIYFVGNSLSGEYLEAIEEKIRNKDVIVNYISKSGNTYETGIAFQYLLYWMKQKYNEAELRERVIYTTGNKNIVSNGYKSFEIPSNIGGRYSVLTPVGLLPMAVSGIDLDELFRGAKEASENVQEQGQYASIRHEMFHQGKTVEALVAYEPKLHSFIEWWKQLYAESLGKKGQGILPIGLINTTDLHSLGQYVQEGTPQLFETIISMKETKNHIKVDGRTMDEVNKIAMQSTSMAHAKNNVVNLIVEVDVLDAYHFGYLVQFFMSSCAISGYLDEVNAFDQPGVEEYKTIMRELLFKKI